MDKRMISRKCIYFDLSDPKQYLAAVFLSKCGRKQSKFLGIVVDSFIKSYGLDVDNMNSKEVKQYFDIFEETRSMDPADMQKYMEIFSLINHYDGFTRRNVQENGQFEAADREMVGEKYQKEIRTGKVSGGDKGNISSEQKSENDEMEKDRKKKRDDVKKNMSFYG